jgi:lipopolysaccharide transport system permease protein
MNSSATNEIPVRLAPLADMPPSTPVADQGTGYELVIKAGRTERLYWRDLWRYRELLFLLAYRDIAVHYKQTVIGIAWALLRPLVTMLVFVFVFSMVARLPSGDVPYPLLVLAGMLPWQMFATALSESSNSLVNNANLVAKVYFPRLVVPLSALMVGLVDFLVCLPVLIVLMIVWEVTPTWRLAFLPLFMGLALTAACGLGLWLCALNVRYRDVRYIIPFVVQFGLYLSPVGYTSAIVPSQWRALYRINPMAGVIDGIRWSLFGPSVEPPFAEPSFAISLVLVAAMLVGGLWYFRRTERTFADVI